MGELEPSTPDPDYVEIAAGLIRGLLQLAGGAGFTWALTVNASQVQMAASAAVVLASLLWSAWHNFQVKRRLHVAAVESAAAGQPLAPR